MTKNDDEKTPSRKRRTFEHVLEDLSENHLERKVLMKGHVLRRPRRDYGVDVTMFHYANSGEIENGEVRFQLKAPRPQTHQKRQSRITSDSYWRSSLLVVGVLSVYTDFVRAIDQPWILAACSVVCESES